MSGIEAVLAAHEMEYERRCYPAYACSCEEWDGAFDDDGGPDDGRNDNSAAYRAHVAAEIAAWLLADEQRTKAAEGINEVVLEAVMRGAIADLDEAATAALTAVLGGGGDE